MIYIKKYRRGYWRKANRRQFPCLYPGEKLLTSRDPSRRSLLISASSPAKPGKFRKLFSKRLLEPHFGGNWWVFCRSTHSKKNQWINRLFCSIDCLIGYVFAVSILHISRLIDWLHEVALLIHIDWLIDWLILCLLSEIGGIVPESRVDSPIRHRLRWSRNCGRSYSVCFIPRGVRLGRLPREGADCRFVCRSQGKMAVATVFCGVLSEFADSFYHRCLKFPKFFPWQIFKEKMVQTGPVFLKKSSIILKLEEFFPNFFPNFFQIFSKFFVDFST